MTSITEKEKQRVLKRIRKHKPDKFYPSDIAFALDMDYFLVGNIIIILEKEGLIEEAENND